MPVHSSYTMQAGSGGRILLVYAQDTSGRGATGLSAATPGARAAYVREGEAAATFPLDTMTEVDAELLPGGYRVPLPDEAVAAGAPHALVLIGFDDARVDPIDIELVAYDPLDEACIGMAQLQDRRRHEFLRRALPNLTEMEFEAGLNVEKTLSDFLDERGGA